MTMDSLLASARSFPDSRAASEGRRPAAPEMPFSTMSAVVPRIISSTPSGPQ